jgi:plasmid replication initiation protein
VADAVLKDLMPAMEHPFYALSKKPDTAVRRYEQNDLWLEVIPSVKGQATIYDKDILIYAVSQIMHKINRNEKVDRRLRFRPRDLLIFTNRGTGGRDYDALMEGLDRLAGTVIKTNIRGHNSDTSIPLGDQEEIGLFHLIENAVVRRKNGTKDGRILWAEIQISEWVFNNIRRRQVLTLHRNYFRLRKPIERRLYEIARKLCGSQPSHQIGLEKLLRRTGARMPLKRFRHAIRELARLDHLPDYSLRFDEESDNLVLINRGTVMTGTSQANEISWAPTLKPETHEKARAAAPGWDTYALENEWRRWMKTPPRDPDSAFIGFCRSAFKQRDSP